MKRFSDNHWNPPELAGSSGSSGGGCILIVVESKTACLYVCSTPIGNLQDVSLRLLDVLKSADVIAAEDTRHTRKLLTHFEIHPPLLVSYHQHNQKARSDDLIRWWSEGKTVALVSDAGTPGISDPGDDAVSLAIAHQVPVVPIPGASAVLAALVASGFPSQPFLFLGFLPRQRKYVMETLQPYVNLPCTLVCYEAPHRLVQTLEHLASLMPHREAVVAKELTKRYEAYERGTVKELAAHFHEQPPKGEFVIVLGPPSPASVDESTAQATAAFDDAVRLVQEAMEQGATHTRAVKEVAQQTGIRRNDLYQKTIDLKT